MERSAETAVFFSALQLAETLTDEGVIGVKLVDFIDPIPSDLELNVEKSFKIPQKEQSYKDNAWSMYKILSETINEIVSGVETDLTKFEQDHWKFEITTMLLMLSLRESIDNYDENQFEMLDSFSSLSTDLVLKLVAGCDLEIAFIDVLQQFNVDLNLIVISEVISCFVALIECGVTTQQVSVEYGSLINSILGYFFIHSNSPLLKACVDTNLDDVSVIIEGLLSLLSSLVGDNSIHHDEGDIVYPYTITAMVGLINLICYLKHGVFVHLDILAIHVKSEDIFSWPQYSIGEKGDNTIQHIHKVLEKYSFECLDKNELILDLFEEKTKECLITNRNLSTPGKSDTILTKACNILKSLHTNEKICKYFVQYLDYSRDINNIEQCNEPKWVYSCSSRLLIKELQDILPEYVKSNKYTKEIKGEETADQCLIIDIFQSASLKETLITKHLGKKQQMEKCIFSVGERCKGYEQDLHWLLNVVGDHPNILNSKWLACMDMNIDLLIDYQTATDLLNHALKNSSHHELNSDCEKQLIGLFLKVFSSLTVQQQNKVIKFVISKRISPTYLFDVDPNQTDIQLTALLNRISGEDAGIPENIAKEFAILVLKDPIPVIDEVISCALRNAKQGKLVVELLKAVPSVACFITGNHTIPYISYCLKGTMLNIDSLNNKQASNFLALINGLVSVCEGEPLIDKIKFLSICVIPYVSTTMATAVEKIIPDLTWVCAMKVFLTVIETFKTEPDIWKLVSSIQPVVLIGQFCCLLNDIELKVSTECIEEYTEMKALLIQAISKIQDYIIQNLDQVSINEINWLYYTVNQLPGWHIVAYLTPIFWTFEKQRSLQGQYPLQLPVGVSRFLRESSFNGRIKLDTELETSFSPKQSLLKLCAISDSICQDVINDLNAPSEPSKPSDWIIALIQLLPWSLPEEWKRIHLTLLQLYMPSSKSVLGSVMIDDHVTGIDNVNQEERNNSKHSIVVQNSVAVLLLNVVCLIYELNTPVSTGVLLRGFTSLYGKFGIQVVQKAVKHDKQHCTLISLEIIEGHLFKLCSLIVKFPAMGSFQDQLTGPLLEVLDCYNDVRMLMPNERQERHLNKVKGSILCILPEDVKTVALKKLCC